MDIPYTLRSEFIDACKEALISQQEALNAGQTIQIALKAGGYSGKVTVNVRPGNPTEFGTDWTGGDPTRFPARIKAAASALRECGYKGSFNISHANGVLSIQPVA